MHRSVMMSARRRRDGVLHEYAAVARVAIPARLEPVATLECLGQFPVPRHLEAVADAVHALESQPAVRFVRRDLIAELHGARRIDLSILCQVRLNHAMIATGLKKSVATAEDLGDILALLPRA